MDGLSRSDYSFFRDIVRGETGIELGEGKTYLVTSRLGELCKTMGVATVADLIARIRDGCSPTTLTEVVEAMTTNETYFFRDDSAYRALREVIFPRLIELKRRQRRLRIWSAACSTGQEPYSISMMVEQDFPELRTWDLEIVATDIAEQKVLTKARLARYHDQEVQRGLSETQLLRFFERIGKSWYLVPSVKNRVRFRKANLLALPALGCFDLVLCRNVLIYFDPETKKKALAGIRRQMQDQGILLAGASEILFGVSDRFKMERTGPGLASYYIPAS